MKALSTLSVCCALLCGCAFVPTSQTAYTWSYAMQGDTMYVVKTKTWKGPEPLPIPERGQRGVMSRTSTLMAIDMRGNRAPQPVREYELIPKDFDSNEAYPFIETDGVAVPRVWRSDVLLKRLAETAGINCSGSLEYDKQDQRVVWLYCGKENSAYRFDPPYAVPCLYRFGPEVGVEPDLDSKGRKLPFSPNFYSISGTTAIFARVGSLRYRLDGCSNTSASKVDVYANIGGSRPASAPSKPGREIKRLIGITDDLRIYVTDEDVVDGEVLVERRGKEPRHFPVPPLAPLEMASSPKYDAKNNLVIWYRMYAGGKLDRAIYALDLGSGAMLKAFIPMED